MSHTTDTCQCSTNHQPYPLDLEVHHIWPKSLGGPDTPANKITLCPTAHTNVHELLRAMMHAGRPLRWNELDHTTPVSRYAYQLALRALEEISRDADQ